MAKQKPAQVITRVEFDDTFLFVPLLSNLLPLRRWDLEQRPGSEDLYRTQFQVADFSGPARLLCNTQPGKQNGIDRIGITINGQKFNKWESGGRLNQMILVADISRAIQPGRNEVFLSLKPVTGLFPWRFWIEGDFALRRIDGEEVLFPPEDSLRVGSWTARGYPYYWGAGRYRQWITIPETMRYRRFFVRFESVGDSVEVGVNGKTVETLFSSPWECDVTDVVALGENKCEFVVTNSVHNAFETPPGPSGLLGPVVLEAR